jgi:hypothetical protein
MHRDQALRMNAITDILVASIRRMLVQS